jgi:hypothetical protein
MNRAVAALAIGNFALAVPNGTAQPALTDQQIAAVIVKEGRDVWTSHPCACPEDLAHRAAKRL